MWYGDDEVDHEVGVAVDRELVQARGEPDVLADVHAERQGAAPADEGVPARPEVAHLVEDGVVGEMALVVDPRDLAVVRDRGCVVDVLGPLREADDRGDPARRARDLVERRHVLVDELGTQEEVLGRVAGQDQLGEGDQLGAHLARPIDEFDDAARVAREVSDGGIHLGEGDAHDPARAALGRGAKRAHGPILPWRA